MPDDLGQLPKMSPADRQDIPPNLGRFGPSARFTVQTGMVLPGVGLILISGFFLGTLVLGPAMETNPDNPAYWSEVIERVRRYDGGLVTVPTILGLLLGALCVI